MKTMANGKPWIFIGLNGGVKNKEKKMKAQDYVDKYLNDFNEATDEKSAKELSFTVFMEFCDEVTQLAKQRHVTRNEAVISIIKEIGQKWNKFCRIINQQRIACKLNEDLFLSFWKKTKDYKSRKYVFL